MSKWGGLCDSVKKSFVTLSKWVYDSVAKRAYTLHFDVISGALNIVFIANLKKELVRYLALYETTHMNLQIYRKRRKRT